MSYAFKLNKNKNCIAKLISLEAGTEELGLIAFIFFVIFSYWILPLRTFLRLLQDIIFCLFEPEVSWHIIYPVNTAEIVTPIPLGFVSFFAMCKSCLKCIIFCPVLLSISKVSLFRTCYHSDK